MTDRVVLHVNGRETSVATGTSVAVAVSIAAFDYTRRSVTGQPRGPLCGMGICFECRATIDGRPHQRTCQIPCRDGMEVITDA